MPAHSNPTAANTTRPVLARTPEMLTGMRIALAFGLKSVFLVLTLMGLGTMWMVVFADVGASLLVVGNGLRLLRK